jgi:hypothetical protein
LIDWFCRRQVTIGRDIQIYRQLGVALSMNQIILTKFSENFYSDSGLIRENWTLRFSKPETLVLQPGAFSKYRNFLVRAPNHVFYISILIISMRDSSWRLQVYSLSSYSCCLKHFFISLVKFYQIVWETRAYLEKHAWMVQFVKYIKLVSIYKYWSSHNCKNRTLRFSRMLNLVAKHMCWLLDILLPFFILKTVMVCDNDLEYVWSRDRENDGKTGDARNFR